MSRIVKRDKRTGVRGIRYTDLNGEVHEIVSVEGNPLINRRERFAQLVAFGTDIGKAYAEAYEKPDVTLTVLQSANHLMADPDIRVRIQELRRPIQRKLQQKWEYTIDRAYEDCQTAYDLAYSLSEPKTMLKAIELRSRLSKLLTSEVNVHHSLNALDEETTDVLVALRDEMKRRKQTPKNITPGQEVSAHEGQQEGRQEGRQEVITLDAARG